MANIKTVLIALFILLNYETGNAQDHNLSREQIKKDISYLINSLENVHINPFNKYNKTDFLKGMQKAENELSKSTNPNPIEFYKKVQPEIVKLNDGHTYIHISEYDKYDTYIFPFDLDISKNSIKITNQKSNYFNKDKNLFISKGIKKINNKSAKEIIDMSDKYISGENEITRITAGKYYFEFFFNLFIDNKKGYTTIEFNDESKEKILLLKKSEWKNTVSQTNENDYYNYDVFKDYAILNFKSFEDLDKFKNFLSNMFKDLGNKKINTLIIDIRDNGGGNSDLGDELLKYLVSVPFTQYEKTLMKYSEISKNNFKTYPNIDKDYLSSYLNKKNGTIDTIDKSKNLTEPFNTEKRYSGKVFLLINSLTFSSAADFAQAFKYYKIGRIIGDETGGQIISPGESVNTKLPNSKLDFTISSSRDYDIGAKENDWHGVIPDVKINSSEALKYIIEIIMQTEIKNEWIYEQMPNEVWEYLTQAELIALWLMPNNFKPVLGQEFQFQSKPIPTLDLDGIFYCKILEIVPFQKLIYSWKGGWGNGGFTLDTVVEWTLKKYGNGTKLLLKQTGFKEANLAIFNAMFNGWQTNIQKMITHLNANTNASTNV